MTIITEITDADLSAWIPGTRFFKTDDDQYFVIDVDRNQYPPSITTVIRRNTALFYCNPDASVTDLNPDALFPPQTTAEQAIEQMGWTLTAPNQEV